MIKIAIVEDEKKDTQTLCEYLKKYEMDCSVSFKIETFEDGLDIISEYKAEYDIIFLDIQMKHLDGMRTAERIRELDKDVEFIFITSTAKFAVQGYLVDAMGYVLKPVPYIAFSRILGKAVEKLRKKLDKTFLNIHLEGGQMRIDIDQIYYIESQRNNIMIYTEQGQFHSHGPLKKLEESLTPKSFFRCHKAYLVNLRHVYAVLQDNKIKISNGQEIYVSRQCKKIFMESLTDYIGGM